MNILQVQDDLKNFSQQQLIQEMKQPKGVAPQFLVLGEITRRKRMSDDMKTRGAADQGTVAQDVVSAAGVPQGGLAQMSQAMAPKSSIEPNMQPPSQAQPQAPMTMASGGILSLAVGGKPKKGETFFLEFPNNSPILAGERREVTANTLDKLKSEMPVFFKRMLKRGEVLSSEDASEAYKKTATKLVPLQLNFAVRKAKENIAQAEEAAKIAELQAETGATDDQAVTSAGRPTESQVIDEVQSLDAPVAEPSEYDIQQDSDIEGDLLMADDYEKAVSDRLAQDNIRRRQEAEIARKQSSIDAQTVPDAVIPTGTSGPPSSGFASPLQQAQNEKAFQEKIAFDARSDEAAAISAELREKQEAAVRKARENAKAYAEGRTPKQEEQREFDRQNARDSAITALGQIDRSNEPVGFRQIMENKALQQAAIAQANPNMFGDLGAPNTMQEELEAVRRATPDPYADDVIIPQNALDYLNAINSDTSDPSKTKTMADDYLRGRGDLKAPSSVGGGAEAQMLAEGRPMTEAEYLFNMQRQQDAIKDAGGFIPPNIGAIELNQPSVQRGLADEAGRIRASNELVRQLQQEAVGMQPFDISNQDPNFAGVLAAQDQQSRFADAAAAAENSRRLMAERGMLKSQRENMARILSGGPQGMDFNANLASPELDESVARGISIQNKKAEAKALEDYANRVTAGRSPQGPEIGELQDYIAEQSRLPSVDRNLLSAEDYDAMAVVDQAKAVQDALKADVNIRDKGRADDGLVIGDLSDADIIKAQQDQYEREVAEPRRAYANKMASTGMLSGEEEAPPFSERVYDNFVTPINELVSGAISSAAGKGPKQVVADRNYAYMDAARNDPNTFAPEMVEEKPFGFEDAARFLSKATGEKTKGIGDALISAGKSADTSTEGLMLTDAENKAALDDVRGEGMFAPSPFDEEQTLSQKASNLATNADYFLENQVPSPSEVGTKIMSALPSTLPEVGKYLPNFGKYFDDNVNEQKEAIIADSKPTISESNLNPDQEQNQVGSSIITEMDEQAALDSQSNAAFEAERQRQIAAQNKGSGGKGGKGGTGSSASSQILDLLKSQEANADSDKWMALANAGMALMSSKQPTLGGALGEAGQVGIAGLMKSRQAADAAKLKTLKFQAGLEAAAAKAGLPKDRYKSDVSLFNNTSDNIRGLLTQKGASSPADFLNAAEGTGPDEISKEDKAQLVYLIKIQRDAAGRLGYNNPPPVKKIS